MSGYPYETRIELSSTGEHVAWVVDGPTLAVGDRTTCEAAVDRHRRAVPTPDPGVGT